MLSEMKLNQFIEVLSSKEPAPGGGSASALAGAVGIALGSMVVNLTLGKEKYKEHEILMREIEEESQTLIKNFVHLIDEDTKVFNQVSKVFEMPKKTEEDKINRKNAMEKALKNATMVPFAMMENALDALKLIQKAMGKSNTNAISDLGVGALNLKSAIQGAWLNVLINLGGIKNPEFVKPIKENGQSLLIEATIIADNIYEEVEKSFA